MAKRNNNNCRLVNGMLAAARIVAAAAAVAASECPSMEIARSVCRNEQAYFSLNKRVDSFYTCFYADNNKTEPRNVIARVGKEEANDDLWVRCEIYDVQIIMK